MIFMHVTGNSVYRWLSFDIFNPEKFNRFWIFSSVNGCNMPQHFCPVCLEDIPCKRCKGSGKYYPPYSTHKIVHDVCHGTGKIPHNHEKNY